MTVLPFTNAAAQTAAGLKGGEAIGRYFVYKFNPDLDHTNQYTAGPEMNGEIARANSGDLKNGLISIQRLDEFGRSIGVHFALTSELTLLKETPEFNIPNSIDEAITPAEILAIKDYS